MRVILWPVLALLVSSPAYAGPDLTGSVQVVVGNTANADGEVPVTFTITVTNQGDEACEGGVWVHFWDSYPCDCPVHPDDCAVQTDWYVDDSELGQLDPGESVVLGTHTAYVVPLCQPFTYMLYIDSFFGGFCEEDDEGNNIICDQFHTKTDCPDLAVKMFVAEEKRQLFGGEFESIVRYLIMVENIGNEPAPPFDVDLFYDSPTAPTPGTAGNLDGKHTILLLGSSQDRQVRCHPCSGTIKTALRAFRPGPILHG